MKKLGIICIAVGGLFSIAWYVVSPDGSLGYDEGTRLVEYTSRAADKLRGSSDFTTTFTYTPKYGNDQSLSVEFTEGEYCALSGCNGAIVVVHASKGKSGAGLVVTVAPRSISKRATISLRQLIARCSGVSPLLSFASIAAPQSSNSLAIPT